MATIALYAGKINQMPGLIKDIKKSVADYKSELFSLKKMTLSVNKSVCNLDDVVSSIQTSTQAQEDKIGSLETISGNIEQFTAYASRIDGVVADLINQRKDDFFATYYYLKPDCEKNGWEKFCDGLASVGAWCKEHWKLIVVVVLVIVAVAVIICTAGVALGPLAAILVGAAKGLLIGALIGGTMGGLSSMANGESFWAGVEDGAFTGALTGALCGGVGGAFEVLGSSCQFLSQIGLVGQTFDKTLKVVSTIAKISGFASLGMFGFDFLALGAGAVWGKENPFTAFNAKLHENALYNTFQITTGLVALGTGSFARGMGKAACFIAGTLVLTSSGFLAIEKIKAGDKVISTNTETFEVGEKSVAETYIREVPQLVHLTINGEFISTTVDHPFYVQRRGFVVAGELLVGDQLLDSGGKTLIVEDATLEILEEPVTVYNFQVEDFHTYHVGTNSVLVHNADYSGDLIKVSSPDSAADKLAERIDGESRVRFSNDTSGREFDAVSTEYIGQNKPAGYQMGSSFRNQAKATFEAASQNGKKAYFHFEGPPAQSVIDKIAEYGTRYGVEYKIDIAPLN